MPIHDWTRVDANLFHDFHQTWSIAIRNALNGGLLPNGRSGGRRHAAESPAHPPRRTGNLRRPCQPHNHPPPARPRRLRHRDSLPRQQGESAALRTFVEKTVAFLRQGVHLLVIDLFPPSARDPQGMAKAIWDEIEEQTYELPADKRLTLAAFVAGLPKTAYIEEVAVGDDLPDMPAYLDPDSWVPVPLEATYQATWASRAFRKSSPVM
jgi:hypothetical protein